MAADHSNTITVNIFLGPSPPSRATFGIALLLVDQATNSLNGARVMSFADADEAQAAQTAGYISATTLDFLQAAFSQIPTPAVVKVGRQDTAGTETIPEAIAAIEQFDPDWYGLAIYSRTDADIVAAADDLEARNKLFVGQSDDASWLDAGLPAGLATLSDNERTAMVFHDADAQPADLAWLVSRLVFDPDTTSAPWEGQVRDVAALTTGLTAAQRNFITDTNKGNVGLPFSSAPVYMSPGQNMTGRGFYEMLSADWFKARVSEDVAFLKLQHTARGEKLTVDAVGQAKILAILNQRLQQGETAGHFALGQTRATGLEITSADIAARRLRFKVEAQIAADARNFVFNVFLQPDALQAA